MLFILLSISILSAATAQTAKCGIDTRALVKEELAAGATEISFLAKMQPGFDRGVLEKAGIVIGAQAGQIVTLRVPVESLAMLEDNREVLQYSISHRIARPDCNDTRFDTRTDSVQNGLGVIGDTSYNGEGVYIGITDWGFDYTHINYNSFGKVNWRIEKAWDHFRLAGPAPAGFTYGTELTTHDELIAAQGDTSNLYGYGTHGTHVAGICAGRGVDGNYRGQAPGAKLLLCSFGLGEAEWMDGVAWMKQVAEDSSRRLVVNSSWGMYSFSCIDGHSLLSQAINNWSDEGVVFCTSAGNNGDGYFHISRTFSPGTTDTLKTIASYYGSSIGIGQVLIMWGEEGKDFEAGFRENGNGNIWSIPMLSTAMGDTVIYDSIDCGGVKIGYRAIIEHSNPFDNRPHIQLDVDRNNDFELQLFITANEGTVHAWNVTNKENHAGNEGCDFAKGTYADFTRGDANYGIGEPACAAKCISVAAHGSDHYNSYTETYSCGNIAYFSSYGPIIDGRQKPEVSAPGVDVVSSISYWSDSYYAPIMQKYFSGRNYTWAKMSGTSMSCPAVTGIVALLLQARPNITVDEVREALMVTARNDIRTGELHANDSASVRWGWGKVDALRAINYVIEHVGIRQAEEMHQPLLVCPNPAIGRVTVQSGCGESETLTVYNTNGVQVMQMPVRQEASFDVSGWASGIYIVRIGSRTAKLIVR